MSKSSSVVEAKFRRFKINSKNTKLWKEVSEDVKSEITKEIKILDSEVKVLYFFENSSYWWLLTNQRLILSIEDAISYFNLEDIIKVEPTRVFENDVSKQNNCQLTLCFEDNKFELVVEKGTWHAICNILKFIIN